MSAEELEARVEDVYRSVTRSEVVIHLGDLPLRGLRRVFVGHVRRFQRAVLRTHLFTYATANASLLGIWELTGHGAFWPAWFLIPTTALLGWHLAASRGLTRALSRHGW